MDKVDNQIIEGLLKHVSVRSFTSEPLSDEVVKSLVTAAQAASTASFQQSYSIIDVVDDDLREKVTQAARNQRFMNQGGRLFVFCGDLNRNEKMAQELGVDVSQTIEGIDATLVGAIDASLAAQNMVIAAESMGLGVCFIGGIRDNIEEVSELLDIPEHVFPVYGLVIGHPKGKLNDIKPRLPFEAVYHKNQYQNKMDIVKKYDKKTNDYYNDRYGYKTDRSWAKTAVNSLIKLPRSFMKKFLNDHNLSKH
ncbi:nadph-fmn oxidoreductase [Companilactobacillus tucceti DSM 20183]|uniref:Nadph-fmn oxidoreductase n=1 Tax=Companilactobacillus tucceti DSM 20183 TaxID=1423811 RepID=A0A0R1J7N9_9LACO|nr:oxygen-insensitive NADPH nitroreductase [Companilactobacillus tucceti]KRK63650.1 nadph-fmn oxidoreductase [Companilactobacillus tucceti DSM 20183]